MVDFLAEKRAEIDNRLKELRPLHEEYLKLERAKAALDGVDGPTRGRPRGSAAAGTRRRRRGRGSTRGDEALALIRQNPAQVVVNVRQRMREQQAAVKRLGLRQLPLAVIADGRIVNLLRRRHG